MKNIGVTCYMNATLQCLCQIRKLVKYFKYYPYINEVISNKYSYNKLCLTTSFKELVDSLWPSENYSNYQHIHQNSNNKYYAPYNFKKKYLK